MSDSYKYIDLEYTYTDPKTGVLRNLANITDEDILLFAESGAVTKRVQQLHINPIKIIDINSLFIIHQHLFQDIYAWAGKRRLVEISKGDKQFFPTSHFQNAFRFIDSLILGYKKIKKTDKLLLAQKLAEILDTINYLHPFREGNGRAQREFIRLLALEKELKLHLNPPDNSDIYKRYMYGTINSDLKILTDLIFELINNEQ
ncbi:MAG: filamentation induced by camp protein fic [Flavobacteriia bacterium]|nr:filamentation induced by camp protein fic [Flavobacteriia bacterium]OIP46738.1 MAG: filamentation induced by camp protein fic [Flavobacteriaceae bacterium CG2_30_31_66]PIV95796.1 MAG: filamentation induced by camp protein fic [Flavobacteriaceae bacterium CG17_big_fil_post_rev_8_21_14_2_50_31_13]PIX13229.1 MAG: filamentation induced by camp protein fic [Flavobacteriaceae bacterium CG_4_8_14_3_um_filter_31_8]PIY16135.1 MAG: filamentation induced by camp protein fic [Flavobacteriaceae bacterium